MFVRSCKRGIRLTRPTVEDCEISVCYLLYLECLVRLALTYPTLVRSLYTHTVWLMNLNK